MAYYTIKGNSRKIVYPYKNENGVTKQQWETYMTELKAIQRKARIDYLQKIKDYNELLKLVNEYKEKRELEKATKFNTEQTNDVVKDLVPKSNNNLNKTYGQFAAKCLPFKAKSKRFSGKTYDEYASSLKNHALPYFRERIMSTITSAALDGYIEYLTNKPCKGYRSYNRPY